VKQSKLRKDVQINASERAIWVREFSAACPRDPEDEDDIVYARKLYVEISLNKQRPLFVSELAKLSGAAPHGIREDIYMNELPRRERRDAVVAACPKDETEPRITWVRYLHVQHFDS
jgi:hypothetical protein